VIGTSIGRYQILAELGRGGMGEVFRATDSKLGRAVALKVLPPEMARDADRLARFQREARAIAALNHPHIVTIHSVDEIDGIHFLTMELIDGESLAQLIPHDGLAVDRTLAIGTALADALAAAHDKGIVHRDLKPGNVMMTNDGRVKVLDFGLAKEFRSADPTDATLASGGRTEIGVVLGTPAYMSPEQVAGRPMDHRTDIFSLGIVLYQMASGRRPFDGSTSIELASAILRDTPRPLSEIRSDVPADLGRLIRRCLEKDVLRRVQTARDVGNELREIARAAAPPPRTASVRAAARERENVRFADEGFWVAVLPFKYSGGNPDVAALAEGLSEEIVTGLSRFSYLKVLARAPDQTVMARYVISGSLRQSSSQLRLAVQLVDTISGAHLWAETYDRPFRAEDVFPLQDDLVPRIVSTVADWYGVLPQSMSEVLRLKPSGQLTPYEAVLRSFGYGERRTPEEHATARTALERAVQQAPGYADGWALLSIMCTEEYATGFNLQPDPLGRALHAARQAADAAPSNALAHIALARARFFRKEFQAFRTAADRAIALNPLDGGSLASMGLLMAYSGEWEHGCAMVERAAQRNPHHPGWYWFPFFYNAYRKGDYHDALSIALKINLPHFFYTHLVIAATYGQLAEQEAAHEALRDLLVLKPDIVLIARDALARWYPPDLVEQLIDGLRKAGLDIAHS
jgi:TolB-like protein